MYLRSYPENSLAMGLISHINFQFFIHSNLAKRNFYLAYLYTKYLLVTESLHIVPMHMQPNWQR